MDAFLRFVLVGGTGFAIDAGLTLGLILVGLSPVLARGPAILCAMAFTWSANRVFTYRARHRRSAAEAVRYATVAAVMAGFNYLLYLGLLWWGLAPIAAVTLATAVQTVLSFKAYRRFVFREVKS
jgi:putative flippase GtrA